MDRTVTMTVDCEWPLAPLRCPSCGDRAGGYGQFWARTWVELNSDTAQPYVIMPPAMEDTTVECGACEHHGALSTFMPPWRETRRPLTAGDRRLEAAWITHQAQAMLNGNA